MPPYSRRVPWDVLRALYDELPLSKSAFGQFAYIADRAQELYVSSSKWNEDVSELCNPKGNLSPNRDRDNLLNLVADLSANPILQAVSSVQLFNLRSMRSS
jgi:hypothetical protein